MEPQTDPDWDTPWDTTFPQIPELAITPWERRRTLCAGECGRRPRYRLAGCKSIGSKASWYCARCRPPAAVMPCGRCRGGCGRRGDFPIYEGRRCCEECLPLLPEPVMCLAECGRRGTYRNIDGAHYCGMCRPTTAKRSSRLCACGTLGSYQDIQGMNYCGKCRPEDAVRTHGMCVGCGVRRGSILIDGRRYCARCTPEPRPARRSNVKRQRID
jgi:hypothetical protein